MSLQAFVVIEAQLGTGADALARLRRLAADHGGTLLRLGSHQQEPFVVTFASPSAAALLATAALHALPTKIRCAVHVTEVAAGASDAEHPGLRTGPVLVSRAAWGEAVCTDVVRLLLGSIIGITFVDRGYVAFPGSGPRHRVFALRTASGGTSPVPTIGRHAELAAIDALLDAAGADGADGGVLVFEGEPGIGKSHLLRVAASRAEEVGLRTIRVEFDEVLRRSGHLAQVVHRSARDSRPRRTLGALLDTGAVPIGDASFALCEAVADLLAEQSRDRPVVLLVEDLHWGDELSLLALRHLIGRLDGAGIGLLATSRPIPRTALLERALDAARARGGVVAVGPLDETEVVALTAATIGAAPGPRLDTMLRGAAGNPLYAIELLNSLDDAAELRITGGIADVPDDVAVDALHDALARRLRFLPDGSAELLRWASLLGSSFRLDDLCSVTGRPLVEVAAGLAGAMAARLVIGDSDHLAFRHDLIRDAVYHRILPAERRELHRLCAEALAAKGAPAWRVARHFVQAATADDDLAADWLVRAASEATVIAPSEAIDLLEQALTIASPHWTDRQAATAMMIEPLAWIGRFEDGERIGLELLASPLPAGLAFRVLSGLSAIAGTRGALGRADELLTRAVACDGAPPSDAARLRCLQLQLRLLTNQTDADTLRSAAREAIEFAEAADDVVTQAVGLQVLALADVGTGRTVEARGRLDTAMRLMNRRPPSDAPSYLIPDVFHAGLLLELDDLDGAETAALAARDRALQRGVVMELPILHVVIACAHLYRGDVDDAQAELDTVEALQTDIGISNLSAYVSALVADIAMARGDHDRAGAALSLGFDRLARGASVFGLDWLLGTQARHLAAGGRGSEAFALAESCWHASAPLRYFLGHRERAVFLTRLAVEYERRDLVADVGDALARGAAQNRTASADAAALHCEALAQADPVRFDRAVARYDAAPIVANRATVRLDAARAHSAAGNTGAARQLVREAIDIHERIGATGDAAAAARLLRHLGGRMRTVTPPRPTVGWDALTATERRVCDLVVEGLTNSAIGERLCISSRTVETHLAHTFRKLGLSNRAQLAAALARRSG